MSEYAVEGPEFWRRVMNAEQVMEQAVMHANKLMSDVSRGYPGYAAMWMMYYYEYYLGKNPDDKDLEWTHYGWAAQAQAALGECTPFELSEDIED